MTNKNAIAISLIVAILCVASGAYASAGSHAVASPMLGPGWSCTHTLFMTTCVPTTRG
jgi:hypothetical protein